MLLEGLIIGGNFAFQNRLDLTIKTARTNSPWSCIPESLLWEGYLRLRFGAYFREGLFIIIIILFCFFFGGGAYYRNFTVYFKIPVDLETVDKEPNCGYATANFHLLLFLFIHFYDIVTDISIFESLFSW